MKQNRTYSDEDLAAVSDNPEWTDQDFAAAQPFRDVFPDLYAEIEEERRAVQVSIDRDIVDRFKAEGPDWELRLNRRLREMILSAT